MCLQPDTLVWYGVILLVTTEIDAAVLGDFQIRVILCLEVRRGQWQQVGLLYGKELQAILTSPSAFGLSFGCTGRVGITTVP